jgi:hypothetical protein
MGASISLSKFDGENGTSGTSGSMTNKNLDRGKKKSIESL